MIASSCARPALLLAALLAAPSQDDPAPAPQGLGPGPEWRGPITPDGANEVFATGDGCSMCHSAANGAIALRSSTGDDISPHGLWQATLMANSLRDPYFKAQVAAERALDPARAVEVEATCVRCHAPMAHHTARLGGLPVPALADLLEDPLAQDGVSCTVCHQAQPDSLGTPESFGGQLDIQKGRAIFGPYPEPAAMPMRVHSGYTPTYGRHVARSALCGSCHTLFTEHAGQRFAEQTPYLEWRNSSFENESGERKGGRTCQDCHMPRQGEVRIARNPGGRDFNIRPRPDFAAHVFAGGNAFMLDLLRQHKEELGVTARNDALERAAAITRRQLADATARLAVLDLRRADGRLEFDVEVENLTGHKFPTGYPSRRAWLHVEVRAGREVLFASGAFEPDGRIRGVADERAIPHRTLVRTPEDVVVYEAVPLDATGAPTTLLSQMVRYGKDNRLLPQGWRKDGPHADATAPVGVDGDPDFGAGLDRVHFSVPLAPEAPPVLVVAWMRYQTIPPSWVESLADVDAADAAAFVRMYAGAKKEPEVAGLTARSEGE